MEQRLVVKTILDERDYQDQMKLEKSSHIVEDFPMGSGILAIEQCLSKAKEEWYKNTEKDNYQGAAEYLRKIAAICISMGEKYGMPKRERYED